MHIPDITPQQIVSSVLGLPPKAGACVLDSCGVGGSGNNRLIAAFHPVELIEFSGSCDDVLRMLDKKCSSGNAAFFTLSYDFGARLHRPEKAVARTSSLEPDVFISLFDCIAVHDYDLNDTVLAGNPQSFDEYEGLFRSHAEKPAQQSFPMPTVTSNFTRREYIAAIEAIKRRIRNGDTYQVNLTQQLTATLPDALVPEFIFSRLRESHPAPFAAFLRREDSAVISASPEQLIRIELDGTDRIITAAPIKGTRPRGNAPEEDRRLRAELLSSEKDRAENVMIVDLLRNDLGRICSFGEVNVTSLCRIDEHPTLFHLVSTIKGKLNGSPTISQIVPAVFPCGSITGAPKISTIKIIDDIEPAPRGLSMGAVGVRIPESRFQPLSEILEMSVAIRTMVVRDQTAIFNVGGGIVIDSDPEKEFQESLLKAKALLSAMWITETTSSRAVSISREHFPPMGV